MHMPPMPTCQDEVNLNRHAYIHALRRSKNQCFVRLFQRREGKKCACAVGVALRLFCGLQNEKQVDEFCQEHRVDLFKLVGDLLGIETCAVDDDDYLYDGLAHASAVNVRSIWRANDRDKLPLPVIAERLAAKWGIDQG